MPRRRLRSPSARVRYDSPDDCCTGCCVTCCCCCCWSRTMVPRKSRIKMLWMYLLIIGVVIGITIGVVFYGSLFTNFSASDMKVIDGKLSHLFCDSVNIDTANPTSDFAPFSAYIVETPLKIDPSHKENYEFQLSFDFHQPWTYATRQFYLLSGSSAKLFCPQVTGIMDIVIIKGQANYTEFIQDSPNYQCIGCEYSHIIYNERYSGPNFWTFSDTDEYFFVFIGEKSLWAECELDLTRTIYKTDISTSSCYKVTTCEFSLDLKESNPPKQIIVKLDPDKVASGKRYMYSNTSVQSTCVARLWIYIVLFLCCPGIICIILSVLIYKCCADPADDDDDDDISNEQSPLLWDSAPSYSSVVVTEPPKYEDIMADNDNRLPSYEEAVASGTFQDGNYGATRNVGINHSEQLNSTDVAVNQVDNMGHLIDIDVGATNRGPNHEANENLTGNTQGPESLNNFSAVSSSVNLDQTRRVLVMNLSGDVQSDDNNVLPSDDLESSSSDSDSSLSDTSDSADSVVTDHGSEQIRNTSTDTGR